MKTALLLLAAVLAVAMVFAVIAGLGHWLGFTAFTSVVTFLLGMLVPLAGPLALAYAGYIGATVAWGWPVWQALLFCVAFVVTNVAATGAGLMRIRNRRNR